MRTQNQVLREITQQYLAGLDRNNLPSPQQIEHELLELITYEYDAENKMMPKRMQKWKIPTRLAPAQIALIIAELYHVAAISCGGENFEPVLGIYQDAGPNKGTYLADENDFYTIARQYCFTLSTREFSELMKALREEVGRRNRKAPCADRNLIAVNNGIFDYTTKTLQPFSPDYVFLSKCRVDYVPNPGKPVIHNPADGTDWDPESWVASLSDDSEVVDVLWQMVGAIIRPNVRWNKSAWLFATQGNNGKGTLCEMMRALVGEGSYVCIPLSDFSKDFALEPLIRATAIIVDENNVGEFLDKSGNLKAVITNDVIQVNRKFKTPVAFQFRGFMVQCLNEMPRLKDKSDSIYRRQLFIPMTKCFTGVERPYIKEDYVHRAEVLQYVLWRVLAGMPDYYQLSEPNACKALKSEYQVFNDPVRQFADEMFPQFQWDLLPFSFLYALYLSWFAQTNPSGQPIAQKSFIGDLLAILPSVPGWYCPGKSKQIRPGQKMDKPEPLIRDYNLINWQNPLYFGKDPDQKYVPMLKNCYRGILRVGTAAPADDDDGPDEPTVAGD